MGIVAVEQFAKDSPVLVSGNAPEFLSPDQLPEHSLCKSLGIELPQYTSTFVPDHHQITAGDRENKVPLGVEVLYTPGHTPDELALWDEPEKMLYVGDTVYEWAHIIFPNEGSIVVWFNTMRKLLDLAMKYEGVRISCGHVTAGQPARSVLSGATDFMLRVVAGQEQEKRRMLKRGEIHVEYVQQDGRFSLICPKRLVEEARQATATLDDVSAVSAFHHVTLECSQKFIGTTRLRRRTTEPRLLAFFLLSPAFENREWIVGSSGLLRG